MKFFFCFVSTIKTDCYFFIIILTTASSRRELYSLGLIDILTYYGMKKKSAHVAKTKLSGSDADGISTVRPEVYARRFLEFIDKHFT